jgi:hypothetical protein
LFALRGRFAKSFTEVIGGAQVRLHFENAGEGGRVAEAGLRVAEKASNLNEERRTKNEELRTTKSGCILALG